jgi:hypothetical protein
VLKVLIFFDFQPTSKEEAIFKGKVLLGIVGSVLLVLCFTVLAGAK